MYGLFNQLFGNKAGIKVLMFWGLWAPFFLGLGSLHKYRQIKKKAELKKLKEKAVP